MIGGSANLNFTLTGDHTTQGDADFSIDNSSGGTIGSDATINVTANTLSAALLTAEIINTGGTIGGDGNIAFSISPGPHCQHWPHPEPR